MDGSTGAENTSRYLESTESVVRGTRLKTTDNGDGTVTVCIQVDAAHIPPDLLSSPDGSLWRVGLGVQDADVKINAIRLPIRDCAGGKAELRFQVMAHGSARDVLFGTFKSSCSATLQMLVGRHPFPHYIERGERAACLRRSVMFCRDPDFDLWMAQEAAADGMPNIELAQDDADLEINAATAREMRAAENLCRVARLHSRREILSSNRAAERVESLLRAYREHLWQRRAALQRAQDHARGTTRPA